MNPVATVLPRPVARRAGVSAAAGLLISAAGLPVLVHLLPSWDALPLGAHLLPMFWTAFVALHLFGLRLGVLTALAGPAMSLVLSGAPALGRLGTMTAELLVFVALAAWLVRRWPRASWVAPLACVIARAAIGGLLLAMGLQTGNLVATFVHGAAGLAILAAINAALIRVGASSK